MSDGKNTDETTVGAVQPVVKWAGGKRQLLNVLEPLFPDRILEYYEPFAGGLAVLFDLQPDVAYINDINSDLIGVYTVIRDNVNDLIDELGTYKNDLDFFYEIRNLDRNPEEYAKLTDVQRAARLLYLNRTCYNGLYRVNSAGQFNVPYGRYKNPNIVNESVLRAVSGYFNFADIHFSSVDYETVLKNVVANPDVFVYLDPPYDPVSETAGFTGYSCGGFTREDQERLCECCGELDRRGIKFMLSNSATDFIMDLYSGYDITVVHAERAISRVAGRMKSADEVVVRNYV